MTCQPFPKGMCGDVECYFYGCAHERAERLEAELSDPRRLIAENGDDVGAPAERYWRHKNPDASKLVRGSASARAPHHTTSEEGRG